MVNLAIDFAGLKFKNPFILAASPSTDIKEMVARGFEAGWASAVLKTTSVENDEVEMAYPIMSSLRPGTNMVGLHNIDLISEYRIDTMLENVRWLKEHFPDHRVIMSIMGYSKEEWIYLVQQAETAGADMVELSISCPQGAILEDEEEADGFMLSQDSRLTEKVTRWAKEAARQMPIYVKIGSAVTDITKIAQAAERGGANGICAIDSVGGIVGIDLESLSPMPSVQGYGSQGGFTGRAIKPVGLRCVADIASSVEIPISGVGGIYTWRDAVEYLLLGATTVQVCTAVMHKGFSIIDDLLDGMTRWLQKNNYRNPSDIIGLSLSHIKDNEELSRGAKVLSVINEELCVKCGLCYVACRDGGHEAITFSADRMVAVDEEACVGCGLCAQVCPVPDCITIETSIA